MITTLMSRPQTDMPHLRIGPYKEGAAIVLIQNAVPPYSVEWDAPYIYWLLLLLMPQTTIALAVINHDPLSTIVNPYFSHPYFEQKYE